MSRYFLQMGLEGMDGAGPGLGAASSICGGIGSISTDTMYQIQHQLNALKKSTQNSGISIEKTRQDQEHHSINFYKHHQISGKGQCFCGESINQSIKANLIDILLFLSQFNLTAGSFKSKVKNIQDGKIGERKWQLS